MNTYAAGRLSMNSPSPCSGMNHFSYLCTYDLYGPVRNVFDACKSITRESGRAQPPPLAQVMDLHAAKIIMYMDV